MRKAGRKPTHFIDAKGNPIPGLSRRPDSGNRKNRWRIIDTGAEFTEPDEQRAIMRFYAMTGQLKGTLDRLVDSQGRTTMEGVAAMHGGFHFHGEAQLWAWVADQIRTRPQYAAEKTGIEQIGYLTTIKKPLPLPSFSELEKIWTDHARCQPENRQKVLRAFQDFTANAGVGGLADITPEIGLAFRDQVWARIVTKRGCKPGPISPKQQQHIFTGIRTLLRFVAKRGVASAAINTALGNLVCLEGSDVANDSDPDPIEVEDFRALLGKAGDEDRALCLLMLNGAFYMREVLRLEWEDIDFENKVIVTRRRKRGECIRVCVLWDETVAALMKLVRKGPNIFRNYAGQPLGISGGQLRFTKLAKLAGVDVTASQLRDGAYTASVSAGVAFHLCKLLAGHSCGIADKYVKRQPGMVAPACAAVYAAYFGKAGVMAA